ncbi:hypothetical protein V8G54_024262 [Vigna mungo]|uniref:Response regulatory domain-containing protein n=1 Tax=Vigna mungo TaxID=3915 RepID=A0AAQ3N6Y8_VIGMU
MAKISSEKKIFCEYPSNLRVLAIDTDPTVLEFIKKVCNEYCYEVITCTESLHATVILQEKRSTIDLVLMEVHMPKMDGYEFLLSTQEIDVPKIMMSFDESKKSVMKTIKLGACDYMIKPLHEDRLRNIEVDNAGESKKSRVVWTTELHGIFVKAVNQIGLASMILQPLAFALFSFSMFIQYMI